MKPHIGSQVIFVGSIFPMKEIDGRIIFFFIRDKEEDSVPPFPCHHGSFLKDEVRYSYVRSYIHYHSCENVYKF